MRLEYIMAGIAIYLITTTNSIVCQHSILGLLINLLNGQEIQTRLVKLYPNARIVGHYDLDKNKTCPNFDVQDYLLHEDIPNYKFQDALTDDADLMELQSDEEPNQSR